MSTSEPVALTAPQIRRIAAIDALRAPAYALGATMAGFATIAREAGFDVWMTVATSALVWGMPGAGGICQPLFGRGVAVYHLRGGYTCEYADVADGGLGG